MDLNTLMTLTVNGLKDKLREIGISTTGQKRELQDRLLQHYGLSRNEPSDDELSRSIYDDVQECNIPQSSQSFVRQQLFTLKDLGDCVSSFTGEGSVDIRFWVNEFEMNADIVKWNDLQRFVYGKQLLRGAAKLFVRSQSNVSNLENLKSALITEFGAKLCSSDVHKLLKNRLKHSNETLREYLYSLMEIGKQINLDEASVIDYFIEGIPDSRFNKSLLYQAKNINDLKEQIKVYERIRKSNAGLGKVGTNESRKESNLSMVKPKEESVRRCFKCGDKTHIAAQCPQKQFKCFKCNELGHRSFECKSKDKKTNDPKKEPSTVNMLRNDIFQPFINSVRDELHFKTVMINDFRFEALIDSGCSLNLIRYDTLLLSGAGNKLTNDRRKLYSACANVIETIGSFETLMHVDELSLNVTFHVVKENDIQFAGMIGKAILKDVDIVLTEEEVVFKNKSLSYKPKVNNNQTQTVEVDSKAKVVTPEKWIQEFDVMSLNELEEIKTMDVKHLEKSLAKNVENLVNRYTTTDRVQQFINNTPPRSTKQTPFKILTGLDMRMANMPELQELLDDEAVELQIFSGEFREWQSFKELFEEYVHNNKDISNSKKMSYLKSCLQGDARLMVSHLITESGANYNTAWELLAHRYDNVRKQFNEQLKMEMEKAQTSLSDYQAFAQEKFAALESQLEAQDVEHKRTLDSYRLEIDNKLSQKQQQLDEAEQRELKLKERFNLLAISEQELCEKLTSTENAYAARFQAATEREHNLNERVQALTKELNGLRASNENRERELRDKLNLSQDEISVLRSSQRSFNETLDRSSGISSPSELARLQSEADSLHCVLELKQKEISKLTEHNEELMRDAEERGILQSKISLLESNNEMLKSELDIKLEKEKDFLRKINYKTKGQKESWRATTGRQDVNRYFIPRESPHFGGSREEGYFFTDERMDLEPPDEEPNEDMAIKDADDRGMTMEDAILNPKAKKKKRMACLPIKHIQQLPKDESSKVDNTKTKKDEDKKIRDTTSKTRDDKRKTIDTKKDASKKPEVEKDKQRDKEKEKDHNKRDIKVNETIEIAEIDPVGKADVVTTIWELLIPWQLALKQTDKLKTKRRLQAAIIFPAVTFAARENVQN
ncbi:uncharacterized protein LOC125778245 [Bactrocera dorsalis]|uniref:Uncharacterized protein LOC125778245 n=1 Tax=Bactrocera dorsalis TaxID=27457 RepID=A0ABM3JNT8_BACDO|nr:uncharacterized protein LOC125778245 [Bactrocera dorsalis]